MQRPLIKDQGGAFGISKGLHLPHSMTCEKIFTMAAAAFFVTSCHAGKSECVQLFFNLGKDSGRSLRTQWQTFYSRGHPSVSSCTCGATEIHQHRHAHYQAEQARPSHCRRCQHPHATLAPALPNSSCKWTSLRMSCSSPVPRGTRNIVAHAASFSHAFAAACLLHVRQIHATDSTQQIEKIGKTVSREIITTASVTRCRGICFLCSWKNDLSYKGKANMQL